MKKKVLYILIGFVAVIGWYALPEVPAVINMPPIAVAIANFVLVMMLALVAYGERRWSHRQLGAASIPFNRHGGMLADLVIISFVLYHASPHVLRDSSDSWYVVIGFGVSVVMHVAYLKWQEIPGHIIEPRAHGLRKLTFGGWLHAAYMAFIVAVIVQYYLEAPVNKTAVSLALLLFIPLAVWQPGWYTHKVLTGKGKIDAAGWLQAVALVALIGFGWYHYSEPHWLSSPVIEVTITYTDEEVDELNEAELEVVNELGKPFEVVGRDLENNEITVVMR